MNREQYFMSFVNEWFNNVQEFDWERALPALLSAKKDSEADWEEILRGLVGEGLENTDLCYEWEVMPSFLSRELLDLVMQRVESMASAQRMITRETWDIEASAVDRRMDSTFEFDE